MSFRLLFFSLTTFSILSLYAGDVISSDAVQSVETVPASAPVQLVDTTGMSKHVIIAGTFQMQAKSNEQLAILVDALNARPEIVALKQAYGFDYISRPSGKYFVVAIEPVYGRETLQEVLAATREVFTDAYEYVRSKKAVTTVMTPAKVKTTVPEPISFKPVAVKVEPTVETSKPEVEQNIAPDTTRDVLKKGAARTVNQKFTPTAYLTMDDMLMYGGIAVVVLLLIIIVMMRGKKGKILEEQLPKAKEDADSEVAVPVSEEVQEVREVPVAPMAEEPIHEVAEEILVTEEEKSVEEVSKPEEVLVVEEPIPAVPEELTAAAIEQIPAAAVVEAPAEVRRKKREPKPDRGKISKEDLAEFSGNRILMAEDNLINQKVINALFADSDIEIVIANDGQEAVDRLASDSNFQMIFMDAHMPVKDGYEASREIRANTAYDHIPIVALSGDIGADDLKAMAEAGMEEQLAKPVHLEDLYDVMYCYFDIETHSEDEEELLPETFELNVEVGLEIAGGDEELYREILNEFVEMYGKSDEMLHQFIVHDDAKGAKALLLDIRGIAANIGAKQLSDTAEELREAILDGKEAQYTPLYERYCEHLPKLLTDIKNI